MITALLFMVAPPWSHRPTWSGKDICFSVSTYREKHLLRWQAGQVCLVAIPLYGSNMNLCVVIVFCSFICVIIVTIVVFKVESVKSDKNVTG